MPSAAHDTELKKDVAIKKVNKVFERKILAKRTLRELKLLRHFLDHENVLMSSALRIWTASLMLDNVDHLHCGHYEAAERKLFRDVEALIAVLLF